MMTAPADFDAYWDAIDAELAAYPIAAEETRAPRRDTDFSTAYDVELTSVGPYRLFAYLAIPKGEGPFPAVINMPRYGSVNNPPHWDDRQRYVVVTLMHRGQRRADKPFAAAYPGLLTLGIDDPQSFIYRQIAADCIRGLEYLLSRPEIDPSRVGVVGDDLAVIAAARRPEQVSALQVTGLMFHRIMEARQRTEAYPIEEVNEELRLAPQREPLIARTVSYFDPINHAPRVTAATQISVGDEGSVGGPEWLAGLLGAIAGPAEGYRLTHEGGVDHDAIDAWLAGQLGATPLPRLWEVTA